MRVFVTGGTGFVGAHVVRAHLARGHRVRCALRPSSSPRTLEGLQVERVEVALDDPRDLRRALRGCDGIQHVAGLFDPTPGGIARMRQVHVDATQALCDAALELGIPRFVLCSSSITLGWGSLQDPADEESPLPDPDRVYGRGTALRAYFDSKLESEAIARQAVERGLGAVTVNPDFVVGSWDVKPTSGAIILAMARRWIPFHPRGGKCFVDAADCGLGHLLALEKGRAGRRYLLGTQNLDYRSFMEKVARVVGRPPPLLPLPRSITRAAGLLGAGLARLGSKRAAGLNPEVLRSMQASRYRDGSRARSELGLPSTPIEQSVAAAWAWFVEHGYA